MESDLFDVDGEGRVVLRVHVQPGAGRSEVVGRHGDALRVRVAAAPEGGRANEACCRLLADLFDVKVSAVTLLGGESSRSKRLAVAGVDPDEAAQQLDRLLAPERRSTTAPHVDRRSTRR